MLNQPIANFNFLTLEDVFKGGEDGIAALFVSPFSG